MIKRTSIRYHILSNILILIAFLLSFAACQKAIKNAPSVKPEFQTKKFYIVGHRGAAGLAPENTIPAFMRAIEIGVDAIEIDVLLTADGKLVVHHDFRLKPEITRKTDGSWLEKWDRPIVKNLTLKELKLYDVGRLNPSTSYARRYPDQEPFDGQSIPTLKEVVSLLKSKGNKNTNLWIEIKTSPEKPEMTPSPQSVASAVIKLLNEEDFMCRAQILSFDWRALAHVQKIAPEVPVVYLSHIGIRLNNIKPGQPGPSPWMAGIDIDDFSGSIPQAINAAGGRLWAPHYKYITYRLLEEAHRLGIRVFVWTPDSKSEMLRMIEMGVDGIVTNRPDILSSLLKKG